MLPKDMLLLPTVAFTNLVRFKGVGFRYDLTLTPPADYDDMGHSYRQRCRARY